MKAFLGRESGLEDLPARHDDHDFSRRQGHGNILTGLCGLQACTCKCGNERELVLEPSRHFTLDTPGLPRPSSPRS